MWRTDWNVSHSWILKNGSQWTPVLFGYHLLQISSLCSIEESQTDLEHWRGLNEDKIIILEGTIPDPALTDSMIYNGQVFFQWITYKFITEHYCITLDD